MNGQPEGMPWSSTLQQVQTNMEDPVVVDNTGMTEVERRLSTQLFYVLALTCRGKALPVVRRSSRRVRVRGVETAVQRV